ncbi:hypothetical protein VNO77_34946 [Canavalia gladiata]|uniref:Uncharacterized protein n=1 Tax=Canavalia gladiata TaxID=3824 RepID=A0AAN9PYS7_CANGL
MISANLSLSVFGRGSRVVFRDPEPPSISIETRKAKHCQYLSHIYVAITAATSPIGYPIANTEPGMLKYVGGTIVKGFTLHETTAPIGSFPSHRNCPLETARSHIANAANSIAQPIHSISALTVREVQEDVHRIINSRYFSSCMPVAVDTHDGIRLEFQGCEPLRNQDTEDVESGYPIPFYRCSRDALSYFGKWAVPASSHEESSNQDIMRKLRLYPPIEVTSIKTQEKAHGEHSTHACKFAITPCKRR